MLLWGELDMATAPELEEHLMLVERDGIGGVILDLRELTFVDSAGVRTLLNARSRAAEHGHRFALVGANEQVRKFLRMPRELGFSPDRTRFARRARGRGASGRGTARRGDALSLQALA